MASANLASLNAGTSLVDPVKADGTSPLITAAMMGHARVCELLIEQGADVELTGINGATRECMGVQLCMCAHVHFACMFCALASMCACVCG